MESHWKEQELSFGTIKENSSSLTLKFHALSTIPEIDELHADCGCTKPKYDADTKILSVVFKAGYIPKHLTTRQVVRKMITVRYKNGEKEYLYINGIKIK